MSSESPDNDRPQTVGDPDADPAVDSDRIRRRLRRRAARIGRREAEEALSKLEVRGELTDEQRRTVEHLGTTLARRLTTVPEPVRDRDDRDDEAIVRCLSRLFDVAEERHPDNDRDRS